MPPNSSASEHEAANAMGTRVAVSITWGAICDLDLAELQAIDPPGGFGRD
ncbi:MAG: hypothetical protein M0002_21065 [Rhodospirillales bacterium]|nr:hypothetical protein [Rhodospirillales bacterium]